MRDKLRCFMSIVLDICSNFHPRNGIWGRLFQRRQTANDLFVFSVSVETPLLALHAVTPGAMLYARHDKGRRERAVGNTATDELARFPMLHERDRRFAFEVESIEPPPIGTKPLERTAASIDRTLDELELRTEARLSFVGIVPKALTRHAPRDGHVAEMVGQ